MVYGLFQIDYLPISRLRLGKRSNMSSFYDLIKEVMQFREQRMSQNICFFVSYLFLMRGAVIEAR